MLPRNRLRQLLAQDRDRESLNLLPAVLSRPAACVLLAWAALTG